MLDFGYGFAEGCQERSDYQWDKCGALVQIVCAHFVNKMSKAFDDVSKVVRVGPCADKLWNKDLLHEVLGKGTEDI